MNFNALFVFLLAPLAHAAAQLRRQAQWNWEQMGPEVQAQFTQGIQQMQPYINYVAQLPQVSQIRELTSNYPANPTALTFFCGLAGAILIYLLGPSAISNLAMGAYELVGGLIYGLGCLVYYTLRGVLVGSFDLVVGLLQAAVLFFIGLLTINQINPRN